MDKPIKKINVLMLGSDTKIIVKDSESSKRMIEYGKLVNRLDIALFTGNFFGISDQAIKISDNVFVYPRSFVGLLGLFHLNSERLQFVLNHRVDVVTSQDPFYLGHISMRLARWLRAGLHVQVHTDVFSPFFMGESLINVFKIFLAKRVLRKADAIRVVSERIKRSIKKKMRLKVEPVVLPIWVDTEAIKKAPVRVSLKEKYPQFKDIILAASRLTIEKNLNMAIRAMAVIVKRFPQTGLIIVGSGPLRRNYEMQIKNYGLEKNIIIEPWTDDLPSYLKTADIFLNVSNYEGYGRTIIEALAAGTPVVTTDVGSADEVVVPGENGFLINIGSRKELIASLTEFLGDTELRARIVKRAKNGLPVKYSREEYLERYAESWVDALKK